FVERELKKSRPKRQVAHAARLALAANRAQINRQAHVASGHFADLMHPAVVPPIRKMAGKNVLQRFEPAPAKNRIRAGIGARWVVRTRKKNAGWKFFGRFANDLIPTARDKTNVIGENHVNFRRLAGIAPKRVLRFAKAGS